MPNLFTSVCTVPNRIISSTEPIDAKFFEEIAGACRENMEPEKFARSCSRLDVLNEIWRHLNGK